MAAKTDDEDAGTMNTGIASIKVNTPNSALF
jgi:hypothetical protein